MVRNRREPRFAQDEQIVLYSQGGFKNPMTSGWKLGHHYLTNKRLLFFQPSGTVYETPLDNIISVNVEMHKFVLARKHVICLTYRHRRTGRPVRVWIAMGALGTWRKKLSEMVMVDEGAVDKVGRRLDIPCSEILWYLWEHRHATIDDLASLIDAPNHMDILLKIREVINPVAEKTVGRPILSFERSRVDYETGDKVSFSWWLSGRKRAQERKGEPLVDIFDEGSHLTVVAELVGVQEKDIRLEVQSDRLTVSGEAPDGEYYEVIALPAQVRTEGFSRRYRNNILEVRLQKE